MCGHDTIGVGTALVEAGMVEVQEPHTYVTLDTAAGLVKLQIEVRNCSAVSVTFVNAPAFVMVQDAEIRTGKYGTLRADIAYGGNIYAILPSASVGLHINPQSSMLLIEAGNYLKQRINEQIEVHHPTIPFENHVTHIEFYEPTDQEDGAIKNAVIILREQSTVRRVEQERPQSLVCP